MPNVKSTNEARKALLEALMKWREDYAAARTIKEANVTSMQAPETVWGVTNFALDRLQNHASTINTHGNGIDVANKLRADNMWMMGEMRCEIDKHKTMIDEAEKTSAQTKRVATYALTASQKCELDCVNGIIVRGVPPKSIGTRESYLETEDAFRRILTLMKVPHLCCVPVWEHLCSCHSCASRSLASFLFQV